MMSMMWNMLIIVMVLWLMIELQCVVVYAAVIHVDSSSSNSASNCTGENIATACPTIESGLLLAGSDDTVLMEPGIYSGEGNEALDVGNTSDVTGVSLMGNVNSTSESSVRIICTLGFRFLSTKLDFFTILADFSVENCRALGTLGVNLGGGGIEIIQNSGISVVNVAFWNNTARFGGGLLVRESTAVIDGCSFEDNTAAFWGGGLKIFDSGVTIQSSVFTANNCDGSLIDEPFFNVNTENVGGGGAVHANGGSFVSVNNSFFVQNFAKTMAGAFCVSTMGSATFDNVVFDANYVRDGENCLDEADCKIRGGALLISNTLSKINYSNFTNNSAATSDISQFAQGGALYVARDVNVQKNADITITKSFFYNNSAYGIGDNNAGGHGGAIYRVGVEIIVEYSTFEGNLVRSDGMFTEYPSAGGAIYLIEFSAAALNHCLFESNVAYGGRAGAVFATDSTVVSLHNSTLRLNHVTSSYNFKSSGGAISIAQRAVVNIRNCTFQRNSATPKLNLDPRTYSGVGGAIFIETATANIYDCLFSSNYALSGQFDSGAGGGAIGIENSYEIQIFDSVFILNSARGYDHTSSYSTSGSGGAIMLLFSTAYIDTCLFWKNLVTAGGAEFSVGGAVTAFYDVLETSTSSAVPPLQFHHCEFDGNSANGEICGDGQLVRAGQGGAVGLVGVSSSTVIFNDTIFTRNIANTESSGIMSSFGGALYYTGGSSVSFYRCSLLKNVAYNGFGDDICSGLSGETDNYIELIEPVLDAVTPVEAKVIHLSLLTFLDEICDIALSGNSDRSLMLTESMKAWGYEWENVINKFSDPWYGVEFVKDSATYVNVESQRGINMGDIFFDEYSNTRPEPDRDLKQYPSVLISSGIAKFYEPTFVNYSYQICAADIITLLADQGQGAETSNIRKPTLQIVGDVRTYALEIVSLAANVTVIDQQYLSTVMLKSLLIVNSTLYHSNNINVSSFSAIVGSTCSSNIPPSISNISFGANFVPIITYRHIVSTGFTSFNEDSNLPFIQLIQDRIFSSEIVLLRSSMRIVGQMFLSTVSNLGVFESNNTLFVHLSNRSTIIVETTGEIIVDSMASIVSENVNETSVLNAGLINIVNNDDENIKGLRVYGNIYQTVNATTIIRISEYNYDSPALVMASNATFNGVLNVSTIPATTMIPSSDSENPSVWNIIEYFDSVSESILAAPSLRSVYPEGLYFDEDIDIYDDADYVDNADLAHAAAGLTVNLRGMQRVTTDEVAYSSMDVQVGPVFNNDSLSWIHSITSSAMSCSARNTYYNFSGNEDSWEYRCHVCLLNETCGFCSGSISGGCQSSMEMCSGGTYFHTDNCCPDGCNNRGTCEANDELTSFTCHCDPFWDGSACDRLSVLSFLLISVGIFSILIALIILRYYFKYRHQKRKVLDDLRENLLGGGADHANMSHHTYLQGIQQDLILRDVFVPYDEIKVEKKIGEGSFGEVYMATFRGAQVAVKQMRTPVFLQFTDNDIEEFRKEAYMMSRLRHPNIVLVMGVSILEQEAPQPPPGYDDDDDVPRNKRGASTDSQGGKKRTFSVDNRGNKKSEPKIRSVCIITEYLEQGSLADILYGNNKVSDDVWTYELVLTCALQAARGMLYLHSYQPPICHRDLKSSNLVVDDHWVVKVTDFGMSRIVPTKIRNIETGIVHESESTEKDIGVDTHGIGEIVSDRKVGFDESANEYWERESFIEVDNSSTEHTEMTSNLGTTAWCAPELLAQGIKTKYSVKVDVYSFGVVLWELWERKKPYEEMTSRFDIIDAVRAGRRPPISPNCPPTYRSLIQRCWHELPARRPTFAYIVRYIKDELAHIKRQRNLSTTISPYSVGQLLSSGVDPSSAARAVQRAYNNSLSTTHSPSTSSGYVAMNESNDPPTAQDEDRDSLKKSSSLLSFMFSSSSKSEQENSRPSSMKFWSKPNKADEKTDRYTIGGEMGNAGMSRTPPSTSDTNPDYYLQGSSQSESHGSTQQTRNAGRQWRDKYVLKFSGWNSTKPDSNLPPVSSRSSQATFHDSAAQRQATITESSQYVPPVLDDQSSEGSNGRNPSFDYSKEVVAHGKLLQPRSTYEMDSLMSSRSVGPQFGRSENEKSYPDKGFQRKRSNSL